ncbi:MAG: hypothetical protein R2838_06830 [Caldilineaceae bacterium]
MEEDYEDPKKIWRSTAAIRWWPTWPICSHNDAANPLIDVTVERRQRATARRRPAQPRRHGGAGAEAHGSRRRIQSQSDDRPHPLIVPTPHDPLHRLNHASWLSCSRQLS